MQEHIDKNQQSFMAHQQTIESRLKEKENELEAFHKITEDLNEKLSQTRAEVFRYREEAANLKRQLEQQRTPAPNNIVQTSDEYLNEINSQRKSSNSSVAVPLQNLLTSSADNALPNSNTIKEMELQTRVDELSELLVESESRIQQLLQQENVSSDIIFVHKHLNWCSY